MRTILVFLMVVFMTACSKPSSVNDFRDFKNCSKHYMLENGAWRVTDGHINVRGLYTQSFPSRGDYKGHWCHKSGTLDTDCAWRTFVETLTAKDALEEAKQSLCVIESYRIGFESVGVQCNVDAAGNRVEMVDKAHLDRAEEMIKERDGKITNMRYGVFSLFLILIFPLVRWFYWARKHDKLRKEHTDLLCTHTDLLCKRTSKEKSDD